VYTTGGLLRNIPGRYTLPLKEGTYTIVSDAAICFTELTDYPLYGGLSDYEILRNSLRIHGFGGRVIMNTNGNAETYCHPLVGYLSPAILYDAGWYAWFADACRCADWNTRLYCPPVLPITNYGTSV
jgi:hypothetical protein